MRSNLRRPCFAVRCSIRWIYKMHGGCGLWAADSCLGTAGPESSFEKKRYPECGIMFESSKELIYRHPCVPLNYLRCNRPQLKEAYWFGQLMLATDEKIRADGGFNPVLQIVPSELSKSQLTLI
jgi:hypothetical protein